MSICKNCGKKFHACSSCCFNNDWEYYYCGKLCWEQSDEYKLIVEIKKKFLDIVKSLDYNGVVAVKNALELSEMDINDLLYQVINEMEM